jgi:hypothetical protein
MTQLNTTKTVVDRHCKIKKLIKITDVPKYHFVGRHNKSKFLKYQNNFQTARRNPTTDSIFMFK